MPGVIIAGVVGDMAGASIAYSIGYFGQPGTARAPGLQASREPIAAGPGPSLVRALRLAGDLHLPDAAAGPRRVPVCGRRGAHALSAVLVARHARLHHLDRRLLPSSARPWAATGRPGATTWSTSTTPRRHCWWLPSSTSSSAATETETGPAGRAGRRCRPRLRRSRPEARAAPGTATRNAWRPRCPRTQLRIDQALLLGALHGPAELLPISSSGHVTVIPWLLGWDYDRARPRAAQVLRGGPARRHRGGAADHPARRGQRCRHEDDASPGRSDRCSRSLPPALVGYKLERFDRAPLRDPADDRRRADRRLGGDGLGRPQPADAPFDRTPAPRTRCISASPRPAR